LYAPLYTDDSARYRAAYLEALSLWVRCRQTLGHSDDEIAADLEELPIPDVDES
jgi:hypothetical protein